MPGSGNAGIINYSVFEYMENDSVDILEFETGGKYGIAITAYGENDRGEDVMVVDSVETPSHVIDREDVSNTLAKAIEDYAKNQGCEEVIYNSTVGNSAPKEFYDNISGERYEETSDMEVEIEDEKEIRIESSTDSLKGKKAAI
ncbi:MAG: hypothetical protein ABEI53_01510 [Candidatus Magasanikbacteria bacterium]